MESWLGYSQSVFEDKAALFITDLVLMTDRQINRLSDLGLVASAEVSP
jgi:hypothetical protein